MQYTVVFMEIESEIDTYNTIKSVLHDQKLAPSVTEMPYSLVGCFWILQCKYEKLLLLL